ncbi:MAG: GC-type dockerin domain-anchored protein [Phycisphaerales bacterium]
MNRSELRNLSAASALALLAGAATAGPVTIPGETFRVDYAGAVSQDFIIPGYYGSSWRFVIEGADGGDAERRRNGEQVEFREGGEGATIVINCNIGTNPDQLRPGGKLRFVIGEGGEMHGCPTTAGGGFLSGAGGGGGGGTGLLYLPPGETNWNNAQILAVAGGGGGAFVLSGGYTQDSDGGGASLTECGGNPTYGCSNGEINYACNGDTGTTNTHGSEFVAGRGALDSFPNGGRWVHDYVDIGHQEGAFGFGGGGIGWGYDVCPGMVGGGGGYSGGGGWDGGCTIHPMNFPCRGGGGGGGSYTNPFFARSELRFQGNTDYHGLGYALPLPIALVANDEWYGAVELHDGDVAAAVFDAATPRATLDFCGQPVTDPDVWFKYTNDQSCPQQVTLTTETYTFDGMPVLPETVKIYGYTGQNPSGSDCRSSSVAGVYQDVVQPGETITFRLSSANPEAAPRLFFGTQVQPGANQNLLSPTSVLEGLETTELFCGPSVTLDYTGCDPTLTDGYLAYYEFVNSDPCAMDATFQITSGVLNEVRVFDIDNACAEAQVGALTSTLAPGERMLLQIVSQTGSPVSFRIDTAFAAGQPDCDNDGIPDACDTDNGGCPVANDDMANAIPLPLGQSPYSSAPATLDGASSCSPTSSGLDNVDVWFTYIATQNGQLVVSSITNSGTSSPGYVGISLFTQDGQTELACDAGAQFRRVLNSQGVPLDRDAVALTSVVAGQKVLIRLTGPDVPYTNPLGHGAIFVDLDTSLPNDTCEHATVVTTPNGEAGSATYDLTYSQLDPSPDCLPSFFNGLQLYDAWFEYTATEDGMVRFSAGGSVNSFPGAITAFDGCGGSQLGCVAWTDTPPPLTLSLMMSAGETVKVRVSAIDGEFGLSSFSVTPPADSCGPADLAEPFGQLDFSDIVAFLTAFGTCGSEADLAPPFGQCDFSDVIAYLTLFGAGCP